jgi:hypothetical protein
MKSIPLTLCLLFLASAAIADVPLIETDIGWRYASEFRVETEKGPIVIHLKDGSITFPSLLDESAKAFWIAVAKTYPQLCVLREDPK